MDIDTLRMNNIFPCKVCCEYFLIHEVLKNNFYPLIKSRLRSKDFFLSCRVYGHLYLSNLKINFDCRYPDNEMSLSD